MVVTGIKMLILWRIAKLKCKNDMITFDYFISSNSIQLMHSGTYMSLSAKLAATKKLTNTWGGEGRGGEGRGGEGRGGMTVIHILMAPQYLNSNHVTYYVIT